MTFEKLLETGMELGLTKVTAAREISKIVSKLDKAAEDIADKLEATMRDATGANGTPSRETIGAQSHLLRSIRMIVIADMLRRVRYNTSLEGAPMIQAPQLKGHRPETQPPQSLHGRWKRRQTVRSNAQALC